MLTESIKNALGEDLAKQVEEALKGKGKGGNDLVIVVGNDGTYVPAEKYEAERKGKASAETALKQAAESLKAVGGSGDPSKIAEDVKAAQSKIDDLGKAHKAELQKIQRATAIKTALVGKVHDAEDIIKLLDMDALEVDDSGALKSNVDDLLKPIKEAKPYLFVEEKAAEPAQAAINGAQPAGTSAATAKTYTPEQVGQMSMSEYRAYREQQGNFPRN